MMTLRFSKVLPALAFSLALTGEAHAAACLSAQEAAAEQIRLLQTQMMVGALQCRGQSDRGQRVIYNQFIKQFGPELIASNDTLIAYFQRVYGVGFRRQMDSHVTAMANRISSESYKIRDYCGQIATLGQTVLKSNLKDLKHIAASAPLSHALASESCDAAGAANRVISTD